MARTTSPKDAPKVATVGRSRTRSATPKKAAKVTKSARVYAEFEKGASLTEAAKATGVDPAYVWDLAATWQKRTGKQVPRNGRPAKVAK
jgi:hypothetical protein